MDDLISRQAAIDTITDERIVANMDSVYDSELHRYKRATHRILASLPSVDAVPVIRCAECKWFQCNMRMDGYLPKGVDEFECRHWCGSCDPVDFCSYGERREE